MKLLFWFLRLPKKVQQKTQADNQGEMFVTLGKQQFQKLKELGLTMPVRLI